MGLFEILERTEGSWIMKKCICSQQSRVNNVPDPKCKIFVLEHNITEESFIFHT